MGEIPGSNINRYIGKSVGNGFQIKAFIGKGGAGSVYYAESEVSTTQPVAIKFLSSSLTNDKLARRFAREAKISAQLGQKSQNIVQVKAYGLYEKQTPFYVMEFLKGKNLDQIIKERPLSLSDFLTIIRQVCLGLQTAHQGVEVKGVKYPVIHRDIKPSNIFIAGHTNSPNFVKILDFGLAKLLYSQANLTQTGDFLGTLGYCSPEQMQGEKLDHRADIYSLGVLMCRMLTGEYPWAVKRNSFETWYKLHNFEPPRQFQAINPELKFPPTLENLVLQCLTKQADDRPKTVAQILTSLDQIIRQTPQIQLIAQAKDLNLNAQTAPPKAANSQSSRPKPPRSTSNRSRSRSGSQSLPPTASISGIGGSPSYSSSSTNGSNSLSLKTNPLRFEREMDSHGAMIEQTLRKAAWPNNRPISKIVFPKLFQVDSQVLATLWFMVSAQELKTLQSQSAIASDHCHIITCSSPHPMILWATTVGTQLEHPQWLSCFLDLKTKKGDLITRVLAEQGRYRVLFFALENPQCCAHVMQGAISPIQRQDLQSWKNTSQTLSVAGNPEESKQILRTELNYLKSNFLNQPPSFTEDHLKQPLSSTPKAKSSISFPSPFSKLWQGWSNALNKS